MGWRGGATSDPSSPVSPRGDLTDLTPFSPQFQAQHTLAPAASVQQEAERKQLRRRRLSDCQSLKFPASGFPKSLVTRVRSKDHSPAEELLNKETSGGRTSPDLCNWCCRHGVLTARLFSDSSSAEGKAATAATARGGTAITFATLSAADGGPEKLEGRSGFVKPRNYVDSSSGSPPGPRVATEARPHVSGPHRSATILVVCLLFLPLVLLVFFAPLLYMQLSPSTKQLLSFFVPALRLWKGNDWPVRQHLPSMTLNKACTMQDHASEIGARDENTSLPTAEALRTEFSTYTEGALPAPPSLKQHTAEFEREIIEAYENIYVAVGFGLANCIIIDGLDGVVLIDAMESIEVMREVWTAWNQKRDEKKQPEHDEHQSLGSKQTQQEKQKRRVRGIVYTHFHTDHTFGAAAVYEPGYTEVHAHWLTKLEMEKVLTVTSGSTYRRSMRQFGVYVDAHDYVNAGIGPFLRYSSGAVGNSDISDSSETKDSFSGGARSSSSIGSVLPTHVMWGQRKEVEIAGVQLVLLHAPGESRDQTIVWLPASRVLVGADNIYKALPNIYAIRGTETRSCSDWVASLDLMRSLRPKVLLLGHTKPLFGEEHIFETLTAYRDTIQFIHDQTVRLMNKGVPVNDIAHAIDLPTHLKMHPYLQQHYGLLQWAVRAVFAHYMGWFGGSPEGLSPLTTIEKAEALQQLAGGYEPLLQHAISALRSGHEQWALELSSAAHMLKPGCETAKIVRVIALRALASRMPAASGRNWYLTAALEAEGKAKLVLSDTQKREVLHRLSIEQIFLLLPARIEPHSAEALDTVILFVFEDQFVLAESENSGSLQRQLQNEDPEPESLLEREQKMEGGNQEQTARQESRKGTKYERENDQQHVPLHQCVHFRRGIVYTRRFCEKEADATVETTKAAWLRILTRESSAIAAAVRGEIKVRGSLMVLLRSLAVVELDVD